MSDMLAIAENLVERASAKGADAVKAGVRSTVSLGVAQRMGKREKLERAEVSSLGLVAYIGHRKASVSTSDFQPAMLEELVERVIAMARAVPEDEFAGLAEPELLATDWPELDLIDPNEPDESALIEMARVAEQTALDVPGVTNSEGAEAGWTRTESIVAMTNGFHAGAARTDWALSAAVVAGEGTAMERDYDYTGAIHGADLEAPDVIGRRAGERAVKRLNPCRIDTGKMPIVFDPRVSRGLIGNFAGAINGASIARGTSFLKDSLGKQVFAKGIRIVDDPHRRRGLRSRPFDTEGVANRRQLLIEDGVLQCWLLNCRSARQLGLKSNGHASSGGPSPSNLYIEPGRQSPAQLMADIAHGFYVCELMGMGVNGVTGDYSQGAAGFLIDKGELGPPVSEVTIAGNLKDMFLELVPADDLAFRYGVDAPTIRIEGMTLAGT